MEKQKRERSTNFSAEETDLLISLIGTKKNIIENKKSDASTWQDKEKAWKDIEKAFNSASGAVFRDHKHLKLKYEAIKRDTRKKSAMVRAERYKTGGGTSTASPLTPVQEKVKSMILLSVEGNQSQFDSDLTLPSTSTSSVIETCVPVEEHDDLPPADVTLIHDSSKNILFTQEDDSEPQKKRVCVESQEETLHTINNESDKPEQQWKEWNPTALKSKKHPVLSKPKEKRPFDRLTEEKLEIAKIQRKLVTEELEQKLIQRKLLEKELDHKENIYELEKQHLLLKIKLLQKELGEHT